MFFIENSTTNHKAKQQIENMEDVRYRNIKCSEMSETEIAETSRLFSENYGIWSQKTPNESKRGKKIKFTESMIKKDFVSKNNRFVALAYYNNKLIGHAFYINKPGEKTKNIIWILQLVVDEEYQGNGIATKILFSIWSPSDCYAWGLYTSNPMTVATLEKATMRRVDVSLIEKRLDKLKSVAKDIFEDTSWIDNYSNGMVNTNFYVDHTQLEEKINKSYKGREFPFTHNLLEGHEWLAFTFNSQNPRLKSTSDFEEYLNYSDAILKEAYTHMEIKNQPWASHTKEEIEYLISSGLIDQNDKIIDLGCGIGRHTKELNNRGIKCLGIDFSDQKIADAKLNDNPDNYLCSDIRHYKSNKKHDVVLCLYDVIGSFPFEKDNIKILSTANRCLKKDGRIILSVMNMRFTKRICKNSVEDVQENINELLKLKGTDHMQKTGNIFDGDSMLIDDKTGIVYRKEQFSSKDSLPCEYVIRDRRYTVNGISKMLERSGFEVKRVHCFNSSNMKQEKSENEAREIFVVAEKKRKGLFSMLFQWSKAYWK